MPRVKISKSFSAPSPGVEKENIPAGQINKIAGTSGRAERITALNWISAQNEVVRISFYEKMKKLMAADGAKFEDQTPENLYGYGLSAAIEVRRDEEVLSRKKRLTEAESEKLSKQRLEGFKKPRKKKQDPKYRRIKIEFFELIKKQREIYGFSWADVCAYLQEKHNYIATRAYIQRSFDRAAKEIEAEELRKQQKGV